MPRASPSRTAIRARGSAWSPSIPTSPRTRATSTRAGKWSTRRNGCRDDYVCVRVDSRGSGRSPGFIDHFSPRETKDFYDCIEWAGVQPWSNGKVGLNGISYYGINQWHVASLQPPHLAAMCIWEGAADWYRDMTHHGGILCTFWANWYDMQVKTVQYGAGRARPAQPRARRARLRPGDAVGRGAGENRCDFGDDDPRASARRRLSQGALAAVGQDQCRCSLRRQLGRQGLHPRGNFEGFMRAASKHKWLEVHGIEHWTHFYTDYGARLQRASSTISCKARKTAGTAAAGAAAGAPRRQVRRARTRTSGRSRARSGRKFYLDPTA